MSYITWTSIWETVMNKTHEAPQLQAAPAEVQLEQATDTNQRQRRVVMNLLSDQPNQGETSTHLRSIYNRLGVGLLSWHHRIGHLEHPVGNISLC